MARRAPRSRARQLVTAGTTVALVGAAVYGVMLIPDPPSFDFSTSQRRHLEPIPIDRARACGSVEAIHAQLNAFQGSYQAAVFGVDPNWFREVSQSFTAPQTPPTTLTLPPWTSVELEVEAAALQLDAALAYGMPNFPHRIRSELAVVRSSIDEGRTTLTAVDDASAFETLTRRPFERGQLHAGYASDLVGKQCHVRLGADN